MKHTRLFMGPSFLMAVLAVATASAAAAQTPLGSAFTYQGRLTDVGGPAAGPYDLQFALYDAETSGTTVSLSIALEDVPVAGGLFTVDLDFGAGGFNGDARWLEIGVRRGSETGGFTVLTPRTRLAPAPYALFALQAGNAPPAGGAARLVRDFVVGAGQSVQAGNIVSLVPGTAELQPGIAVGLDGFNGRKVFNAAATDYVSVTALSDTKFVVAYQDEAQSHRGVALVGTVAGDSVSFGPPANLTVDTARLIDVFALSSTRFVIAYYWLGDVDAHVTVGTVSGDSISYGAIGSLIGGSTFNSCARLSDDRFIVACRLSNGPGSVHLFSVSGDQVVADDAEAFSATDVDFVSAAPLGPDRFVIAYQDSANQNQGTLILGSVNGDELQLGAPIRFTTNEVFDVSIASDPELSEFVVAYADANAANRGTARFGKVSDSGASSTLEVAFGAPAVFNPDSTTHIAIAAQSLTNYAIGYADVGNANYGTARLATVQSTSLSFGPERVFREAPVSAVSAAALSPLLPVMAYRDEGDAAKGAISLGRAPSSVIVGTARAAGSAGQSVPVNLFTDRTVSDVHSGLTVGSAYYAQPDGSLTSNSFLGVPVGIAVSATELLFLHSGN